MLIWSLATRNFCHRGRRWRIHGSVGSVPKPLHRQLSVRVRPEQLSAFLMSLMWGMCSMCRSMRSLTSLVVVDLRQVPGKARRGKRQWVLVFQKKNNFLLQVRLLAVLHLSLLFRKVLRIRGQEEVVAIAVMPQFSKGDTNNNLLVYLYKLLAFKI